MKVLWGERRYSSYSFLTLVLDGGELSVSCPGRALPPGKDTRTHWIGGWAGPRAGPDTEARGKISSASDGDQTPIAWSSSL